MKPTKPGLQGSAGGADDGNVDIGRRHRNRRAGGERGFTLVELLVVIGIVAVLTAIAVPVFLHQRVAAYDAAAKSDLRSTAPYAEALLADGASAVTTADLAAEGAKSSPDVAIELVVLEPDSGYCLSGKHAGSPRTWYWDSRKGGLQAPGTTCGGPPTGTGDAGGDGAEDPEDGVGGEGDPAAPEEGGGDAIEDPEGDDARPCNNGRNPGNTRPCEDFPGKGRSGTK